MGQVSVLVVDDSVVIRRLVTSALEEEPDIRVVGTAPNGRVALTKLSQVAPDVVTLDIEMPEMDGLTTLRELRKTHPRLPVIMFSTLTQRGASATLEALSGGASDYVTKPANVGSVSESIASVRQQLVPKIRALVAQTQGIPAAPARPHGASAVPLLVPAMRSPRPAMRPSTASCVDVLAIGCSTGGPEALAKLLMGLPSHLPVPVMVVQHMPPVFTKLFAERLDRTTPLRVVEATDALALSAGTVYIAPGDRHLEVTGGAGAPVTRLTDAPPENFCRPAVDVLFRSVARTYGNGVLAVVLTGMGSDGRRGCEPLKEAGAHVIAQDAETSVVWGMPGAVAGAGLADDILPLTAIPAAIVERVTRRTPATPVTRRLA